MKNIHVSIAVLAMAIVIAGGFGQVTQAHTKVNKSIPEDGASVAPETSKIELHFAGKMRLTVLKIMHAASGEAVSPNDALPSKFVTHVSVDVPPLVAGDYDVNWVGVGTDGHVMTGEFKFSVAEK